MSKLSHFPPQTDIVSKSRSCCCMLLHDFQPSAKMMTLQSIFLSPSFRCSDTRTPTRWVAGGLKQRGSEEVMSKLWDSVHPKSSRAMSFCFVRVEKVSVWCIRGLAEEVRLQANTLKDVLGHAQHRIHRFDLFVSKQGETCNPEQGVERIHLQRRINRNQ